MASSSALDLPSISHVISVRLERDNYPTWLAQIVPVLRSRRLLSYVDGSCPSPSPTIPDPKAKESESSPPSLISNPDYEDWVQKDQLVLSLINGSLHHKVLAIVATKTTARDTWVALETRFASPNQNRLLQLRSDLLRTTRGDSSITDFLDRIHSITDNLALAGAPVHDSDLLAVVMNNVGPLYENTVAAAQAREKPIGMPDLEALLLSAERRLQASSSPAISSGATTMVASRGGRGGRGGRGFGDRGGYAGRASDRRTSLSAPRFGSSPHFGSYGFSQYSPSQPHRHQNSGQGVLGPPPLGSPHSSFGANSSSCGPLQCYNCRGFGHVAAVCPSKATSVPPPPTRLQGMTAHHLSHGGAQQWVADTGANTHITNDLSHLSLAREYHGSDNVGGVLGGTGLPITHIGHSRISHLNSSFSLNNILHCPDASLPLLSVHKFATDNNCFFTFYPDCYFIQDLATGKILFRGKSSNGLYPFSFSPNESFHNLPDRVALLGVRVGRSDLATGKILFRGKSSNGLYPFSFSPNESFHNLPDRVALLGVRVGRSASATPAPDSSPSSTDLPLVLPGSIFPSCSSVSSCLIPPTLQAQPSLPAPTATPIASPDPPTSDPAPPPVVSAPPPSSPSMSSHIPIGLPSPPRSASPPVIRPALPPSRFSQTYSRDPHRKIAFPSTIPVPSGTSSPSSDTSMVSVPNTHLMATRAKAGVRKPNPKYAHHALVSPDDSFEPTSFSQANKLQEWRLAMADEFNALLRAGTWTLVPRTPTMNVLPNKWVFRVKRNSDGTIQRYKARLVANGFHQQPGLDYGETFSPVVNHSTIRLILALSVQFSWPVRQLDVQNAFLQGSLDEEVYMR
ncbi:uncharacterized protein LOC110757711 [Prunus avium]|uniref:Uncharacterized protein LOC110757711 n=1 Tax=Prunus avium TaxID=42229 RepID=A0A6P5SMX7_PRUAV|nr:uncharacterized protein LOC110757711 [Prunus avium]